MYIGICKQLTLMKKIKHKSAYLEAYFIASFIQITISVRARKLQWETFSYSHSALKFQLVITF